MSGRRIILLEFNELCPDLLAEWMYSGLLPNFREFHSKSVVLTADADTADPVQLQPWIQWYSLHTGFSFDQHGVFHLTDGPARGLKDIWRLLLDHGYTVGNCAGMNAGGFRSRGSFYVPDPWCNSQAPYPPELQAYQQFVRHNVQENTNAAAAMEKADYLGFLKFWAGHGMSLQSLGAILRQLAAEATTPGQTWRRAALLDKIQFDIFSHYWRRSKPDFASFFINSTAHFQHAYFHLLRPDAFPDLPAAEPDLAHKDAILFGYQEMDRLLGRFMEFEKDGALLVFTTALSQAPNPRAGQIYYRPRDIEALLAQLDAAPARLLPVMAHQFSAEFADPASAERAKARLESIRFRGAPVFYFLNARPNALFFAVASHEAVPTDARVEFAGGAAARFHDLFYSLPHTKSGEHQPESSLWFKTGAFRFAAERVSILDVLPTLLDYYGVQAGPEEAMLRHGQSLLPLLNIGRYRDGPGAAAPRPVAGKSPAMAA